MDEVNASLVSGLAQVIQLSKDKRFMRCRRCNSMDGVKIATAPFIGVDGEGRQSFQLQVVGLCAKCLREHDDLDIQLAAEVMDANEAAGISIVRVFAGMAWSRHNIAKAEAAVVEMAKRLGV